MKKPASPLVLAMGGIGAALGISWVASRARAQRRTLAERSLATAAKVDLEGYMGLWHELYRIPNRFERDCVNSTAEYGLIHEEKLTIVNTCERKDGSRRSIEGRAWVTEPRSGSKLKVGFFHIGAWYPRWASADYWILDIGPKGIDGHHTYSVVGEPSRRYGWILARERILPAPVLDGIFARLKAQGYARERFVVPGRRQINIRPAAVPARRAPQVNAADAP